MSIVVVAKNESGGFKYALGAKYSGVVEEQSGGCRNKRGTTGWVTGRVVGATHPVLYTRVSRW